MLINRRGAPCRALPRRTSTNISWCQRRTDRPPPRSEIRTALRNLIEVRWVLRALNLSYALWVPSSGAIGQVKIGQAIHDAVREPHLVDGFGEAPVVGYSAQLAVADALRQKHANRFEHFDLERNVHAGGHRERPRGEQPGSDQFSVVHRTLKPDVEQPYLGVADDVGGDQAHRVVTLFDQEYCKLRRAHRLQHQSIVGLGFKPGGLRITVDRPRTIRWRGVDGKVVDVVHLLHVIENQRLALCQSEPARLIQQCVAGYELQNFMMKSLGDFPQV